MESSPPLKATRKSGAGECGDAAARAASSDFATASATGSATLADLLEFSIGHQALVPLLDEVGGLDV
ncbi:MAG TPA: hypothetical protein VN324_02445, partial [Quisquiliibacterium sp.]|nr:hypothetical protein [Quisquiliibacterium sp.]